MQRLNTKRAISLPFIEILGALGFMEPVSQQAETGKDGSGCQQRYKVVSILNSNRSSQSRRKVEETGAYGIIWRDALKTISRDYQKYWEKHKGGWRAYRLDVAGARETT